MNNPLLVGALLLAGTMAFAQEKPSSAAPEPEMGASTPAAAPQDESKFAALLERERAQLKAANEKARDELDHLVGREDSRLSAVAKRVKSEAFSDAEKNKVKSLRGMMKNSSVETREKAVKDLQDSMRVEKMRVLLTKYKSGKTALWTKFKLDWNKLLTSPPLVMPKK